MKKIFPAIMALAILTGCSNKKFDVTLNVPEDFKGQTVVLLNTINADTLGLSTATDTIVSIKGEIEKPTLATVVCNSIPLAQFVVEPGNITLTDGLAKGTESNNNYAALSDSIEANPEQMDSLIVSFMTKYPTNPQSFMLMAQFPYLTNIGIIDKIVDANPELKDNQYVAAMRTTAEAREKTSTGGNYIDFELTDADGKEVSLAEYVAGSKLTIVDFWASWCGPCRAEIPNLISLYNQYKDKGLQVVGVDVWERGEEDGPNAVKEMGIPYPIMYGGTQATTDIYGIAGIPTILVIDSEGTIIARDIRGTELADFVATHLNS
ncbi:MAG: TlpA family protein disulfide reductase [Bacteroides sp.]|nr:TlpA family protein disulfide reductase [Bacteroides sp.]MCM1378549.1 TlpA family protein disulfide reductase [Bacteroides sp.]MCM1444850.1 TlpA family protein disulfide reductase [Prevotella sp.]